LHLPNFSFKPCYAHIGDGVSSVCAVKEGIGFAASRQRIAWWGSRAERGLLKSSDQNDFATALQPELGQDIQALDQAHPKCAAVVTSFCLFIIALSTHH